MRGVTLSRSGCYRRSWMSKPVSSVRGSRLIRRRRSAASIGPSRVMTATQSLVGTPSDRSSPASALTSAGTDTRSRPPPSAPPADAQHRPPLVIVVRSVPGVHEHAYPHTLYAGWAPKTGLWCSRAAYGRMFSSAAGAVTAGQSVSRSLGKTSLVHRRSGCLACLRMP